MKLVKALAAAAMLLIAVIAVPSTAHAQNIDPRAFEGHSGPHNCDPGYMCLYSLTGQRGTAVAWPEGTWTTDFGIIECSRFCSAPNFDNDARSWYNNTGRLYCVSANRFGGNPDNSMPPRSGRDFTPDWWDRASSLSVSGCP